MKKGKQPSCSSSLTRGSVVSHHCTGQRCDRRHKEYGRRSLRSAAKNLSNSSSVIYNPSCRDCDKRRSRKERERDCALDSFVCVLDSGLRFACVSIKSIIQSVLLTSLVINSDEYESLNSPLVNSFFSWVTVRAVECPCHQKWHPSFVIHHPVHRTETDGATCSHLLKARPCVFVALQLQQIWKGDRTESELSVPTCC